MYDPERPLEPPEPPMPRCYKCGAIATEWWPWTEQYYCHKCAVDAAQDYIADKSADDLLEIVGMEAVEWE